MNLRTVLIVVARKILGWGLIVLSALFFATTLILLNKGAYGPFLVGLFFSLLAFGLGLLIQANLEKTRKRTLAIFEKYFPRCPICKSDKGYQVRGFLPSSQYVRCKNCEAEWTSRDFMGIRDLKILKLWNPPEIPRIYSEYVSKSKLKMRKSYPTTLWVASMNGEKIDLPPEAKQFYRIQLEDMISAHKRGSVLCLVSLLLIFSAPILFSFNQNFGYFTISSGASLVLAIIGFYGFTVSKENSYILFCTLLIAMFVGLIILPKSVWLGNVTTYL
jgi:hypothetical protein